MRPTRPLLRLAFSLVAVLTLSSCAGTQEPKVIAVGLDVPWSVAFYYDVALVSERDNARILELDEKGEPREVVVPDGVRPSGDGRLLGIAVHDGYLFAYFTASAEKYDRAIQANGEPGNLEIGAPETVLDGILSAGIITAAESRSTQTACSMPLPATRGTIQRAGPRHRRQEDSAIDAGWRHSS